MTEKTLFDESKSRILEATRRASAACPVLLTLEGGDLKNRYKIERPEMTLGRDLSCDIVLSDAKSSRRHAKISLIPQAADAGPPRVTLTDLNSTNGTYVNGERVTAVELSDGDKITIGATLLGYFLRDQTTLKADESLIRLASVDALTGLANRGIFNLEIRREFERARRYRRPLSLVMFDIDHFKRLNDAYGHQAGDHVLRDLGKLVAFNCRSNDLAARYGGEEFAVLLPETPLQSALIQAERLRKSTASYPFAADALRLTLTISVGVSMLEDWMMTPSDLIECSDQALYRAKDAGRNQVCWNKTRADAGSTRTGVSQAG